MFLYQGAVLGQSRQIPRVSRAPSALQTPRIPDEIVAGFFTQQARIMRRNLPYGPPFNPQQPDDGIERGLVGYFINADFANQFQFHVAMDEPR